MKDLVDSADNWVKAVAVVGGAVTGTWAFLRKQQIRPFAPTIPPVVKKEMRRIASAPVFVSVSSAYEVTFLELNGLNVWVRMNLQQSILNVSRRPQALRSRFLTGGRRYVFEALQVDGRSVTPLAQSELGFELESTVPPNKHIALSAAWKIAYRRDDSELLVSYRLGETYALEVFDEVSEERGQEVFRLEFEPLIDHRRLADVSVNLIPGRRFSRKVVIGGGHPPNTGVNLKWRYLAT